MIRHGSNGRARFAGGDASRHAAALERAREDAEGVELFESASNGGSLVSQREEAEGVEVFAVPDAVLSPEARAEGAPGHETLTGDDRLDEESSPRDDPRHDRW